ncbi:MAG: hypothetical protein BGO09_14350 [Bacteroidetes bacterium 47-18]|nr:MAG: hypothetical protein BGO09_14350 [Bacteroidetes bacterium 47-18]
MKMTIIHVAVLLMCIGLAGCGRSDIKDTDIAVQYNELKDENVRLYDSIASLNILINSTASYPELLDNSSDNYEEFRRVRAALLNSPQSIPDTAVLGGKMHFDDIKVLDENWIYASYNDGHVHNQVIFWYEKGKNNTYTFRVVLKYE